MGSGRIFQISVSAGGAPKRAIHEGQVGEFGLAGDKHSDAKNHGGVDRALCLFSLERMMSLQEAGHPIFPGSTAENLTISGFNWDEVQPGVQLRLGPDVCIEIVSFTAPCAKIKHSFAGGDFSRMSQKIYPGWSRVYARVLKTGTVRTGDAVQPYKEGERE